MDVIDGCPILKPSAAEFADFMGYIYSLEKTYSSKYGIVKIVPPKGFNPYKSATPFQEPELERLILKGPIEQNIYGKAGIYELLLIQKKSTTLADYKRKVLPFDENTMNKSQDEVESLFWRSVTFSPPLYGADVLGSLMDSATPWTLNSLNSLLSQGLSQSIPGINTPYLYVGSWKAMFGWHKEDLDLNAINYMHHGRPKYINGFWYALPRDEQKKLEDFAKNQFPESYSKCHEFLRHKTTMISPYVLKQQIPDLTIHKMIHNPGEFIITFAGAYHAGFNYGFNIAEAVNFATPMWLQVFLKAKSCVCLWDSVKINKEEFLNNLLKGKFKSLPEIREFQKAVEKLNEIKKKSDEKDQKAQKIVKRIKKIEAKTPKRPTRTTSHGRRIAPKRAIH